MIQTRDVEVVDTSPLVDRVVELMRKYSDQLMSLADASIAAVAEARSIKTVFSLDSDFTVYRYRGQGALPGGSGMTSWNGPSTNDGQSRAIRFLKQHR